MLFTNTAGKILGIPVYWDFPVTHDRAMPLWNAAQLSYALLRVNSDTVDIQMCLVFVIL